VPSPEYDDEYPACARTYASWRINSLSKEDGHSGVVAEEIRYTDEHGHIFTLGISGAEMTHRGGPSGGVSP